MKNLDLQVPVSRNIYMQAMFVSWLLVAGIGMCFCTFTVLFLVIILQTFEVLRLPIIVIEKG